MTNDLVGHTASTKDVSSSDDVLDDAIYDPFNFLEDTGDQVDLTTPLDQEEISGTPLPQNHFRSHELFVRHRSQVYPACDEIS